MFKKLAAYLMLKRAASKSWRIEELERRQHKPDEPHYNDSFYFMGRHEDGTVLMTRLGFRSSGETERWLSLKLPELGRFSLPEGHIEAKRGSDISCGGLSYECLVPGERWKIFYQGALLYEGKEVDVSLELDYTATMPVFDFKKDGSTWALAQALAQEAWSRQWFQQLKDLRQIHYEQGGIIKGTIEIDGLRTPLELRAMRDHSFGTRVWSKMVRHLWLSGMMDNGQFLNISLVRYTFLSSLKAGYLVSGNTLSPVIDASSFEQICQGQLIPHSFRLTFQTPRQGPIEVQVEIEDAFEFVMGGVYRMYEGIATLSMGDVKGVGIAEFGINQEVEHG